VRCIVEAASRLDKQRVPLDRFGIQFVQIGTDEDAARALQVLDDELSDRYKIRVGISFVVSLTRFTHQLSRTSSTPLRLTLILKPCSTRITCSRSSSEVSTKNSTTGRTPRCCYQTGSVQTWRRLPLTHALLLSRGPALRLCLLVTYCDAPEEFEHGIIL
jgi:hypothetical protein